MPDRTEQNRTEQNRTEQNRTGKKFLFSCFYKYVGKEKKGILL